MVYHLLNRYRRDGVPMCGLTTTLMGRACRTFLTLAYPGGPSSIPPGRRAFLDLAPDQPLEPLLVPPLCEVLRTPQGGLRGYAFRLGSAVYPHVKLQVTSHDSDDGWIFAVDTHDAFHLDSSHPDAAGWAKLQSANRQLKEQIERAWEADGLLTFNGLLRRELAKR
jgi:hypothetical protein